MKVIRYECYAIKIAAYIYYKHVNNLEKEY